MPHPVFGYLNAPIILAWKQRLVKLALTIFLSIATAS